MNIKLPTQKLFLFSFLILIIFSSCSKERITENRLTKKGGDWNVDELVWSKVEVGNLFNVSSGTEVNAGKFYFKDDGTGSYDVVMGGVAEHRDFTWSTDGTEVTSVKVGSNGADISVYVIEKNKKNEQIWASSETVVDNSTFYTRSMTITMSR